MGTKKLVPKINTTDTKAAAHLVENKRIELARLLAFNIFRYILSGIDGRFPQFESEK